MFEERRTETWRRSLSHKGSRSERVGEISRTITSLNPGGKSFRKVGLTVAKDAKVRKKD